MTNVLSKYINDTNELIYWCLNFIKVSIEFLQEGPRDF